MAWPAAGGLTGSLLLVPLGSTEQHGPHLPLGTDTLVARAVCTRLARARDDVVVAPALPYGSSGEHAGFPGTLSIGQNALETVVIELARSADAYAGVVFVSGHGGNAEALTRAVATCAAEGRKVLAWWPTPESLAGVLDRDTVLTDAHAGRTETSVLLHLEPGSVGAVPDRLPAPRPTAEIAPTLRSRGVVAVSETGVLGDPRGASAAEGQAILDALVTDLEKAMTTWLENAS